MRKSTIILLISTFVVCLVFVGVTGYYIGSKSTKQTKSIVETTTSNDALREEIRAELKEEVKDEVRQELYDEVKSEVEAEVAANLEERIAALQSESEEVLIIDDETEVVPESKPTSSENTTKPTQSTTTTPVQSQISTQTQNQTKLNAYIKVHDVSVSMSGGSAAIEAALNNAVDSSSGTVICDTSSIAGIGRFPIYWSSTDGATATSYITITE